MSPSSLIPGLRTKTLSFVNSLRDVESGDWHFSASASSPSLKATMQAWEIYHFLRAEKSPEAAGVPQRVRQAQDPETGLFSEPLFEQHNFAGASHEPLLIQWQYTDYALHVLGDSGTGHSYPLHFLEKYHEEKVLADFLAPLGAKNPWYASNLIMFLLDFFTYEFERTKDEQHRSCVLQILDYLDATQDQKTGLWGTNTGWNLLFAMAAAYHYYFHYLYWGREIRFREQIVRHTQMLAMPDGLFSPKGGGGGCEDLDAVDILAKLARKDGAEHEKVSRVLQRTWDTFRLWESPDGGFPYVVLPPNRYTFDLMGLPRKIMSYGAAGRWDMARYVANINPRFKLSLLRKGAPEWKYSGLPWMSARLDESDLFSTWFRLLTIALCEDYLGIPDPDHSWQFRPCIGPGWHRPLEFPCKNG